MNKKYIVKNCPALLISGICNGRNVKGLACKNATNCLIKQVIEKCKDSLDMGYRDEFISSEILQLFEIEEVNNDR